jgi:hypothetical protein
MAQAACSVYNEARRTNVGSTEPRDRTTAGTVIWPRQIGISIAIYSKLYDPSLCCSKYAVYPPGLPLRCFGRKTPYV